MFLVTSPSVINVPTRGLLAVETMHAIVQWLANLNIKINMTSMFVNKKHRYNLIQIVPAPEAILLLLKQCYEAFIGENAVEVDPVLSIDYLYYTRPSSGKGLSRVRESI